MECKAELSHTVSGENKSEQFVAILRIHAYTSDLNSKWAKNELGIQEGDPVLRRQYADDDEGIAGCEFRNDPSLDEIELSKWHQPALRYATEWLRGKSKEQFQRLRQAGLKVDFCLTGFRFGIVPNDLLKELGRLELELFLISRP